MNNQEKQLTKNEVIQVTIQLLNNIMVPAGLCEQIGMPIQGAVKNLRIVSEMIRKETEEKEAGKEEEEKEDE